MDVMLDEIDRYVADEQKLVTFGWISRKLDVSSNVAKRLLHHYAQAQGEKVQPMYYLSGRPKDKQDVAQEVHLVSGGKALAAVKAAMEVVSSLHVYSVQLAVPESTTGLWQANNEWHSEDYKQPASIGNPLRDNRYSVIEFASARSDRPRARAPVSGNPAPGRSRPALKAEPKATAAAPRQTSENAAKTTPQSQSISSMLAKSKPKSKSKSDSGPAAPAASKQSKKPSVKPKPGGQTGLSNFFKASAAQKKPAAPKSADAEAADEDAGDDDDDDDDDDEISLPTRRHAERAKAPTKRNRRVVVDQSSDENESDAEAEAEADAEAEAEAEARASAEAEAEAAEAEAEAAAATKAKAEAATSATQAAPSTASDAAQPAGDGAATSRRKRTRTFINSQGMVDTEEIWEDVAADGSVTRVPSASSDDRPGAKKRKAPEERAGGAKGAKAQKPAPSSQKSTQSKKSGSQSIMSFFGK